MTALALALAAAVASLTLAACGGSPNPPAPSSSAASPVSSASSSPEAWIPVATYLFSDEATGTQLAAALDGAGIKSVTVGSLGATVSVAEGDASRARSVLRDVVDRARLDASILAAP